MVGLAGAPSTLIHSFLAIKTILHPFYKHHIPYIYIYIPYTIYTYGRFARGGGVIPAQKVSDVLVSAVFLKNIVP